MLPPSNVPALQQRSHWACTVVDVKNKDTDEDGSAKLYDNEDDSAVVYDIRQNATTTAAGDTTTTAAPATVNATASTGDAARSFLSKGGDAPDVGQDNQQVGMTRDGTVAL